MTCQRADRIQWTLLGLGMLTYLYLARAVAPNAVVALVVIGAAQWILAWRSARRWGAYRSATMMEPAAVMLSAFLGYMLALPFADPPGRVFGPATLGITITLGVWAIIRYPASGAQDRTRPMLSDIRWGVLWGLFYVAAASTIAITVFTVAALAGEVGQAPDERTLGNVLTAYLAAGLIVGCLVGPLRPLGHWPLGAMLLGFIVGLPVYGSTAVAMGGWPLGADDLAVTVGCAALVGPGSALGLRMGTRVPHGGPLFRRML